MQRGNIWIYTVCLFDEMTDSVVSMQVCEVWLRAETSPQDRKWCAFIKTPPQSLNAYRCHNVIDSITRRVTERWERAKGRESKNKSAGSVHVAALEFACYQRQNISIKMSPAACSPRLGFDGAEANFCKVELNARTLQGTEQLPS